MATKIRYEEKTIELDEGMVVLNTASKKMLADIFIEASGGVGAPAEPIILTPSVTLVDTCAYGGDYESGKTVANGSWVYETFGYTTYGYALYGCKKLKLSGAWLHNTFSTGTVRENILFVKGFADEGGGVGVVGSIDIEVEPETYDINNRQPSEYIITVPSDADGVYFSCDSEWTPTLEVIEQITPEEAYNKGYADGFEDGKANSDVAVAYMNAITANGTKTEYRYAFWGANWNDELFKPQTVIKPTNFQNGLYRSSIEYGAYTDLLDFSNCQNLSAAFMHSTVKKLKVIDARKTTSDFNGMANIFMGCSQLESIDEFYPSNLASKKATFQNNTFANCSALTKLIFKSEISQNGLDLQWSTNLSKESIESIINNLSDTTSDLSITLSKTAVNAAIEEIEPGYDTTNSGWWAWAISSKSNWTITLV